MPQREIQSKENMLADFDSKRDTVGLIKFALKICIEEMVWQKSPVANYCFSFSDNDLIAARSTQEFMKIPVTDMKIFFIVVLDKLFYNLYVLISKNF